jgi:hypothetical protein
VAVAPFGFIIRSSLMFCRSGGKQFGKLTVRRHIGRSINGWSWADARCRSPLFPVHGSDRLCGDNRSLAKPSKWVNFGYKLINRSAMSNRNCGQSKFTISVPRFASGIRH